MPWLMFFNYCSQVSVKLTTAKNIWQQNAWNIVKKNLVKNTCF